MDKIEKVVSRGIDTRRFLSNISLQDSDLISTISLTVDSVSLMPFLQ